MLQPLAQAILPATVVASQPTVDVFYSFYAASLRGVLFTGFLTLSGFLFSMMTFIVINMKKEVYDTDQYMQEISTKRELNPKLTQYGPLRRFSRFLFWSVLSSLLTAVSQLTVGLYAHRGSAILCLGLAAISVTLVGTSLVLLACNLNAWFQRLEQAHPKQSSK